MMADEVRSFSPQGQPAFRSEATGFGYASPGTSGFTGNRTTGTGNPTPSGFVGTDRTGAVSDLNLPGGPNSRPEPIGRTTGYGSSGLDQSPSAPRSGEGGTTGLPRRDDDEEGGL